MTAPIELDLVLHASDPAAREAAWEGLVARHTRLFLAVARSFRGTHDEVMERYAYILEKLYEDDCHRLRAYRLNGRARFSTWLTVAARRLCLDHHRARYGRVRATADPRETGALRAVRRRLADSVASEMDTELLPDESAASAGSMAIRQERDALVGLALAALPPEDRLLLALRFEDELSAAHIARVMGFPTPFHVYRRLTIVLAELRSSLSSRGVDGPDG